MKSADIIKRLESEGWTVRVKGSHHQFKLSGKGSVTVKHPDSDIPIGTLRNIYRQAGWRRLAFDEDCLQMITDTRTSITGTDGLRPAKIGLIRVFQKRSNDFVKNAI